MAPQHLFAGGAVARLPGALAWYERFVADEARAAKSLITLMVEDLPPELAAIEGRGIVTGAIEAAPGLYRKTVIEDPEGSVIQLGEGLRPR